MMERLVKVEIPSFLDVFDFDTCMDCIRGKLTKSTTKGSARSDFNVGHIVDPVTFYQVLTSPESHKLFELPPDAKAIDNKWIFKRKFDSKGNVERKKARLVAKGFTQREGIDYNETFSPVSSKDSFRIIMLLVTHYNLELHHIDVKTVFLNGDLSEMVYMRQSEGFVVKGKENLVCKLNKSLYGLKQASRQWYLKFEDVVTSLGFVKI
ncbi:unnamed protein product [Fraxinus pennsylvanica]|uniref:Reverse transcriptase Ty1/copia-type domain-containing protein n=1 Tax=Fraxinus pennsylvanica TaxID=56036 RepID=A0AAD1ZVF7_9LAMI|nr:unnamed protein product [Fraxinus pennsylvanica]